MKVGMVCRRSVDDLYDLSHVPEVWTGGERGHRSNGSAVEVSDGGGCCE